MGNLLFNPVSLLLSTIGEAEFLDAQTKVKKSESRQI
jgi:hypothetical protein